MQQYSTDILVQLELLRPNLLKVRVCQSVICIPLETLTFSLVSTSSCLRTPELMMHAQ